MAEFEPRPKSPVESKNIPSKTIYVGKGEPSELNQEEADVVDLSEKEVQKIIKDVRQGKETSLPAKEKIRPIESSQAIIQKGPTWMREATPKTEQIADIAADIAESGKTDDSDYLLVKAAQIRSSCLKADSSTEVQVDALRFLGKLRGQILELKKLPHTGDEAGRKAMTKEQEKEFIFIVTTTSEAGGMTYPYEVGTFKIYEDGILPDVDEPGIAPEDEDSQEYQEYLQKKHKHYRHISLIRDLEQFQDDFESLPPMDENEEGRLLNDLGKKLLLGKRPRVGKTDGKRLPPKYNEDEVDIVLENFRTRKEFVRAQKKQFKENLDREELNRKERSKFRLDRDEQRKIAINGKAELDRRFQSLYGRRGYPAAGEEGSKERIEMLLGYVEEADARFDTEFAIVDALRKKGIDDEAILEDALDSYTVTADKYIVRVKGHGELQFNRVVPGSKEYDHLHKEKSELQEFAEAFVLTKYIGAPLEIATKPESAEHAVSEGGDKAWHVVLGSHNGLIEAVYNLYNSKLDLAYSTNTRATHKISNIDEARMEDLIKQEIRNNPFYSKLLAGEEKQAKPISEVEANYYLNVARVLSKIKFQPSVAMVKSHAAINVLETKSGGVNALTRADKGYDKETSGLSDTGSDESFAAAMDFVYAFFEKWGNLKRGSKMQFYKTSEFAARRFGLDKDAAKEAKNLLEQARDVGGGPKAEAAKKFIKEKMEKLWGKVLDDGPYDGEYAAWEKYHRGEKMSLEKELTFVLTAEKGFPIVCELIEAYDYDSSGWRISEMLLQLNRMYKDDVVKNLALGYRLREKGGKWLEASSAVGDSVKRTEIFNTTVKGELEKTAEFRPQTLGLWLYQQGDKSFTDWWEDATTQGKAKNLLISLKGADWLTSDKLNWISHEGKIGYAMINDALMDQFLCINAKLESKGYPVVNYSNFDSNDDVVKGVVKEILGDKQGVFCEFLKLLSDQTKGEVDVFQKGEYRQYFKRTWFTDDARLRQVEDTKGVAKLAEKNPYLHSKEQIEDIWTYSETVSAQGEGRRSTMARFVGDFMVMKGLPGIIADGMVSESEPFEKAMAEIMKNEKMFAGNDSALTAVLYFVHGRLQMKQTDPGAIRALELGSFLRTKSSDDRRFWGLDAESLANVGTTQILDHLDLVHSKVEAFSEPVAQLLFDMEKDLGLAEEGPNGERRWRGDPNSPAWRKRYLMYALVISSIIGGFLIKEGEKAIQEAFSGGGKK